MMRVVGRWNRWRKCHSKDWASQNWRDQCVVDGEKPGVDTSMMPSLADRRQTDHVSLHRPHWLVLQLKLFCTAYYNLLHHGHAEIKLCCRRVHKILQFLTGVLNWRCYLTQAVLYNGRKTGGWLVTLNYVYDAITYSRTALAYIPSNIMTVM